MANLHILMVEGTDDEHVLRHICRKRSIPEPDRVLPQGGAPKLLEAMPRQIEASTGEQDVIGVVIDADQNPDGRWQAIRDRLVDAGYQNVPGHPDPSGTILEPAQGSPLPQVGVWVMPDNKSRGILENFLSHLVPQPNGLFDYATNCVEHLPDIGFIDNDKPKAVIHTWLAWQKEPGRPYGTSIRAGFLDHDVPVVDVLVFWINRLFYS